MTVALTPWLFRSITASTRRVSGSAPKGVRVTSAAAARGLSPNVSALTPTRVSERTIAFDMIPPLACESLWTRHTSVAVARRARRLCQALILQRGFEHRAAVELPDERPLYFLPWRLRLRIGVTPLSLELFAPLGPFLRPQEHIHFAASQVNPNAIASAQQRQPASYRGFRRGIQNRGRARRARLPPIANAR